MIGHICIKRIVLGALVGIVTTAVLLFISAVVLCFTPVPDTAVELMSVVATVIGLIPVSRIRARLKKSAPPE